MLRGILLTLLLALISGQIASLPFFNIMGIMIISILLGMSWKRLFGVRGQAIAGIDFSSKKLLRVGIILMGLRLNLSQIADAGFSMILIDAIVIIFTLITIIYLGKWFGIESHLATLIAVGTAVCGAAAIVAVAPLIKGKKEYTALAVACIAILGTIGAIGYIFIYPFLPIDNQAYGLLVGSTLHELAHVIAASVPGGNVSSETAILAKLGRVALLIPVAIVMEYLFNKNNNRDETEKATKRKLPIPWFIVGFLVMSCINTLGFIPDAIINILLIISVYCLSMAMAGLGLSINFNDFKKVGIKPIIVAILGFIALLAISPLFLLLI